MPYIALLFPGFFSGGRHYCATTFAFYCSSSNWWAKTPSKIGCNLTTFFPPKNIPLFTMSGGQKNIYYWREKTDHSSSINGVVVQHECTFNEVHICKCVATGRSSSFSLNLLYTEGAKGLSLSLHALFLLSMIIGMQSRPSSGSCEKKDKILLLCTTTSKLCMTIKLELMDQTG